MATASKAQYKPATAAPSLLHTRSAGVLLHVTSLPSPFGIGDLGPAAYRFIDLLHRGGATWWQVLPLTPPASGDSPYCSTSTFAGSPLLISPERLVEEGLLSRPAASSPPSPGRKEQGQGSRPPHLHMAARVDYTAVRASKSRLLLAAFDRFRAGHARHLRHDLDAFIREQAWWLEDFALYSALREAHDHAPWLRWERGLARRQARALAEARTALAETLDRIRFEQFLFTRQLLALREHARQRGIRLMGDVPIYVDLDSSDVWSHPEQFKLYPDGRPKVVAGVPPDFFSADGQLWGNPLYNWNAMRKDRFDWWIRRIRHLLQYVDVVRIDHFRGLQACWEVPAGSKTAQTGHWAVSPGHEILSRLRDELGGSPGNQLPLVAEDLGTITPEVEQLRDDFSLPGMRILQFGFGGNPSSTMLPHHYPRNVIAYTGTHDNDTTLSWYRHLPARTRAYLRRYAPDAAKDPVGALIRLAMSSVANLAIIPMQDLLRLGSEARMNTPGTMHGNWSWRLRPGQLTPDAFAEFRDLARTYGRTPTAP